MEGSKRPEEMNERELLTELLKQQRTSSRNSRVLVIILAVIAAFFVIAGAVLVPKAVRTLDEANTLIGQGEKTLEEVDGMISGVEELTKNATGLLDENTEAITESLSKIRNIDIDSLNSSIEDLSDILKPLANFFNLIPG